MNVDGLEDSKINIWGLDNNVMPEPEEEFHLEASSSEQIKDQEWVTDNEDNENNNHDTDFEGSRTS